MLPFQRPVAAERGGHIERARRDTIGDIRIRQLVENIGVEDEAHPHRPQRRRPGINQHGTHRLQLIDHCLNGGIRCQVGRIDQPIRHDRCSRLIGLKWRVVVRGADDDGCCLIDALPGRGDARIGDDGAGEQEPDAEGIRLSEHEPDVAEHGHRLEVAG